MKYIGVVEDGKEYCYRYDEKDGIWKLFEPEEGDIIGEVLTLGRFLNMYHKELISALNRGAKYIYLNGEWEEI